MFYVRNTYYNKMADMVFDGVSFAIVCVFVKTVVENLIVSGISIDVLMTDKLLWYGLKRLNKKRVDKDGPT